MQVDGGGGDITMAKAVSHVQERFALERGAFRHSTMTAKTRIKARESARKDVKVAPATQVSDEPF